MYVSFQLLGQLYGLEKFWAFLKYYKNSEKLDVEPKLRDCLNKFNTVEDFRVDEPQLNDLLEGVGSLPPSAQKRRHRSMSESEGTVNEAAGGASGSQEGRGGNQRDNRQR